MKRLEQFYEFVLFLTLRSLLSLRNLTEKGVAFAGSFKLRSARHSKRLELSVVLSIHILLLHTRHCARAQSSVLRLSKIRHHELSCKQ